jgi:hypothetical protein
MNTVLVVAPEEAKKKKRNRQARGNTNTKQKRKQTKTLRMISTAYNNVAECKNL